MPGNYQSSQAWGFGAYFNDTIQVMPWLKLVGGLRWDVYSAQFGNSINSANTVGNTAVPYQFQTDYFTSVRAGAIFEPTKEQSYYVSYSTSFNPSLEQLTSTTGSQSLPPENNEGYEAGVKYEFMNGNLSLNGALFQITKYNARTPERRRHLHADRHGARAGRARRRRRPHHAGMAGVRRLRLPQRPHHPGPQFQNGIGNTTGNVPLNTPKDSGNIWTTYTIKDTYEIGGGMFYVGQRYANNQNTVQVPEYFRFDLTAAYKQPTWELRANVFNLFNTMYYDSLMASDGGRAVPGSGTTGLLTFTYRM